MIEKPLNQQSEESAGIPEDNDLLDDRITAVIQY